MGVGGTNLTVNQATRIGLLVAAIAFGMIALFTSWWTFSAKDINGMSLETTYGPFDNGELQDLEGPVVITGWLAVASVVFAFAYLGFEALPLIGRGAPTGLVLGVAAATVALGAGALLYTTLGWPAALNDVDHFWDGETRGRFTAGFAPGLGWYFAIVGLVALPGAAFYLSTREDGPDAMAAYVERMHLSGAPPPIPRPAVAPPAPQSKGHEPKPGG